MLPRMELLSPSALPWWGWLLCALVLLLVWSASFLAWGASMDVDGRRGLGCMVGLLGGLTGLAAFVAAGFGLLQLVRSVWRT